MTVYIQSGPGLCFGVWKPRI